MGEEGGGSQGGEISLGIEETNALRAKLGLKPLKEGAPDKKKSERDNWKKKQDEVEKDKESAAIMERIFKSKDKRAIADRFSKVKRVGDADIAEFSVDNWVKKSRQLEKEKKKAKEMADMFNEMEDDFITEDKRKAMDSSISYTSKDLTGINVEHDVDDIDEGQTILTLKDSNLRDGEDDVLMNVDIVAKEKSREFIENRKKKNAYNAYGDDEFDQDGNPILKEKSLLPQFDETIEGKKKSSFLLQENGVAIDKEKLERERMAKRLAESAQNLKIKLTERADTYTEQEMVSFKKPKKRRRKKKKETNLTAADLLANPIVDDENEDLGSRERSYRRREREKDDSDVDAEGEKKGRRKRAHGKSRGDDDDDDDDDHEDDDDDDKEETEIISAMDVDENEESAMQDVMEDGEDLASILALQRAKNLKKRKVKPVEDVETRLATTMSKRRAEDKKKDKEIEDNLFKSKVNNSESSIFAANEEAIKTLGLLGDDSQAAKLFKKLQEKNENDNEKEDGDGDEEIAGESTKRKKSEEFNINEQILSKTSIFAALQVAGTKGLLSDVKGTTMNTIVETEEKRMQEAVDSRSEREKDRDKYRHRSREKNLSERDREKEKERERDMARRGGSFEEKKDYNPEIELMFKDEKGRVIDQKAAFKQLSHRFHGNGPGKNKMEKILKKEALEAKMNKAKAEDITMDKLKKKQKHEGKAFVSLGSSGDRTTALSFKKQDLSKKRKASSKTKSSKKSKTE